MTDSARAIENLLYTYAERIDRGDFDGVADLFANGRIVPMPDVSIDGRDAVFELYRSTTRRYDDCGTPKTHHVTTNAIIEVDDTAGTATARSYYTVFQCTDSLPFQPIIGGRYHDTFHRIDGEWWFDTRSMQIDHLGDLSQHLLIEVG